MTTDAIAVALRGVLTQGRVREQVPLAPFTTFRVGGPADWLVETPAAEEIRAVVQLAQQHRLPLTVLGGGSNVLIADAGVRGIVLRVHGGTVAAVDERTARADAGVTINGLVRWTINRGYSGLEAWAGTPGTVGGAIRGNAHFKGRNIGDLVERVRLLSREGQQVDVDAGAMAFAYDYSRVQESHEIVLSADFRVGRGEPDALRATARESLAFRKRTQPLDVPSAGCIFQNPDREEVPADIPASAGALVDRAGLKGAAEGKARVSAAHGNFIVHDGAAAPEDIRRLIETCRREVRDRFGVALRDEIVYLGF